VVCLQELFAGEYPCQAEDHGRFAEAEGIPGPLTAALAAAARAHDVVVVASLFERRDHGLFHNTAVILDADGTIAGVYRKMHIPDDPHYYEKFYFAPGDTGFMSVATSRLAVGPLVCWDQWYPEAARLTAMAGAETLFYPTAIGWLDGEEALHREQYESWDTMLRSHAIANGVFVAAVNRTGREGPLRFWGASVVYAPNGECLAKAPHDAPATLVCECDIGRIEWSRTRWPFFRDRRIDAYDGLLKRWR
jgi:N-carbamoylputrescine amidase